MDATISEYSRCHVVKMTPIIEDNLSESNGTPIGTTTDDMVEFSNIIGRGVLTMAEVTRQDLTNIFKDKISIATGFATKIKKSQRSVGKPTEIWYGSCNHGSACTARFIVHLCGVSADGQKPNSYTIFQNGFHDHGTPTQKDTPRTC